MGGPAYDRRGPQTASQTWIVVVIQLSVLRTDPSNVGASLQLFYILVRRVAGRAADARLPQESSDRRDDFCPILTFWLLLFERAHLWNESIQQGAQA
jgi:hypothetical protein